MKLILDIGNTRIKAAISDSRNLTPVEDWQEYLPRVTRAVISNVSGPHPELYEALRDIPLTELSWDSPRLDRWLHDIPHGMGSDRVAADIGAICQCPDTPLLIIDAGTCVTYDLISPKGVFIGGSITPGVSLRLKSMHDHTAALPLLDTEGEAPVHGHDTATAMRGGAINGLRWEMEGYIRHTLGLYPKLHVFMTGGDARHVAHDLRDIITIDPLLVMKGLDQI